MKIAVPPGRSRAVQYLRMSTDLQRYSLDNQRDAIAVYAANNACEIVGTYTDAGVSGVTTAKRTGLKQLLRDVLAPDRTFSEILVLDVSRWGRFQDPDEAAHYEFICATAGVRVRYCAEAFDDDNSTASTVMKHIKRVMAGEYSRELSARSSASIRKRVLAGNVQGGPPPFGVRRRAYNPDGTAGRFLLTGERRPRQDQAMRWVPGEAIELATLRELFRLYASTGRTITETASTLNDAGMVYRGGTPWNYARIRCALTNEIAIGVFVFNRRAGGFGRPANHILPKAAWRRVIFFDPIVAPALFRKAQRKLADPRSHLRTDDDLLNDLRRVLATSGELSGSIINASPHARSMRSYFNRFGSLSEAYRRIGYSRQG